MKTLKERIDIDLEKFEGSIKKVDGLQLTKEEKDIVELSKLYAQDSRSWMEKNDLNTAFCSIAYAHGLLDAVLKIKHIIE